MSDLTEYSSIRSETESDGFEPGNELSTEEGTKAILEKYRIYIIYLWQARWKLVKTNAIIITLSLIYLLFLCKPYFDSTITILPEYGSKSNMLGTLSSLAAMAGVNIGDTSPTEIYENIIKSESVLNPVVYTKYKTKKFSDSVNLIQYFKIDPDESLEPKLQKRRMFLDFYKSLTEDKIKTNIDKMTKILTVTVEMPESKLSAEVTNNIIESLDDYLRTQMKSYASEQRFYLEKRIAQVKDSLIRTEDKLKIFTERNVVIAQSPNLVLEQKRLSREVEILETIFIELTKQIELIKIDEIKDIPVLNIKEKVKDPIIKTGPRRILMLLVIVVLSNIFAISYILFKDILLNYYHFFTDLKTSKLTSL